MWETMSLSAPDSVAAGIGSLRQDDFYSSDLMKLVSFRLLAVLLLLTVGVLIAYKNHRSGAAGGENESAASRHGVAPNRPAERASESRTPAKKNRPLKTRSAGATMERLMLGQLNEFSDGPDSLVFAEADYVPAENLDTGEEQGTPFEEWVVQGFAGEGGLEPLTKIHTRTGISEFFASAYERTSNGIFDAASEKRALVANLRVSENKNHDPEKGGGPETRLPFVFKLTIRQAVPSQ